MSVLNVFLCATSSQGQPNQVLEPIEIAIGEWRPFVSKSIHGYGEVTEVVTAVLEAMGYRPHYIFMPWGQAEEMVRENADDRGPRATFPFRLTDQRKDEFLFSEEPILERCIKFFYNTVKVESQQPLTISTIEDLQDLDLTVGFVGAQFGFQYPKELTDVVSLEIECTSLYEAFGRLIDPDDPVQVVPSIPDVGMELLYELFPSERCNISVIKEAGVALGDCLLHSKQYFLASKREPRNEELMRKFDAAHRRLQETEIFARIRQRALERPSRLRPEVTITACDSLRRIVGLDAHGRTYPVPRGTRALLLSWQPDVCDVSVDTSVTAEVLVLSGPYRGKRLKLDGRFVVLK